MIPRYKQFIFEDYQFDPRTKVLSLHYNYDDSVSFTETYRFDFPLQNLATEACDRAFQQLFFIAGVSYYKAYLAPEIVVRKGQLDQQMADFYAKTYRRGLGEFFYINQLDPRTPVVFPVTTQALQPVITPTLEGILIGLGGGKDSLVSVELFKKTRANVATWSLNHRPQLTPLVERVGLPHYFVERQWDPSLVQHNAEGALNGHIPISAIFATCGVVVAVLTGRRDATVSNELSANEPTLHYKDIAINHQYSKSAEFEADFQGLLVHAFDQGPRYYSFLRPLSELRIAELFCRSGGLDRYDGVFSSCNRAYVHGNDQLFWDGMCPKCAFFFLVMAPFAKIEQLTAIFNGNHLLHDPDLQQTYKQLLGIAGDKPLDCVGEIKESRTAMRLAQDKDESLREKYTFDIPDDYDYTALGQHHMPPEIYDLFSLGLDGLLGEQHE